MLTPNRRWLLARLGLCLAISLLANADTIVSVTGTGGADLLGGTTSQIEFMALRENLKSGRFDRALV